MSPSEQGFKIIESLYNQASAFIRDSEEFYPFGVLLDKDYGVIPVGVGSEEYIPKSNTLIDSILEYLDSIKNDEKYIGVGIAIDVRVGSSDAIWIRMDHRELDAADYLIEYQKNENGVWEFYKPVQKDVSSLQIWD